MRRNFRWCVDMFGKWDELNKLIVEDTWHGWIVWYISPLKDHQRHIWQQKINKINCKKRRQKIHEKSQEKSRSRMNPSRKFVWMTRSLSNCPSVNLVKHEAKSNQKDAMKRVTRCHHEIICHLTKQMRMLQLSQF